MTVDGADATEPRETVHVSMAVDRGFEVPLGVALLSLAEAQEDEAAKCRVSVLCSGLDADIYRRIEGDIAGRLDVEWVEVDLTQLEGAHQSVGLSKATLFRILLPDLLPADQARTIYLDADTVVRRPLTDLSRIDLGDNLLAAVRDAGTPYGAGTAWRALGLDPSADYFNAGVLVVSLDGWRRETTSDAALAVLRRGRFPWGDQDALNTVSQGRWLELPRRWNLQTADAEERSLSWGLWRTSVEDAIADPAVIHFTEAGKPWLGRLDHPYADVWLAALARSSWAGWTHPSRSVLARGRARLLRAGRVLVEG